MQQPFFPRLMGIVNVTPDSFFDGGIHRGTEGAIAHALRLADEGADILDIGGESTRPPGQDYGAGSAEVDVEEELRRVLPVIEGIHASRPSMVISIDTMKPEVARRAIEAGAGIINDVSGGSYDQSIWGVAAEFDVPYIVMHGHDPRNRVPADQTSYGDVVEDVFMFLEQRVGQIHEAGVREVIADVGIGFAKGADDSIRLLRRLGRFRSLGVPLLVGVSRKSFIGRLLGGQPAEERLFGTLAAHLVAAAQGAAILRVHDVRATRDFFSVYNALSE